jgi:hypothetical protein
LQERRLTFFEDWDRSALEKRRAKIVEWALDRWRVDQAAPEPPQPEEVDEEEADDTLR